jgi:PilZ domain
MTSERRKCQRLAANIPARWDGSSRSHACRIEDISVRGCFVNSLGAVGLDQVIDLELRLPSGDWLKLRGVVTSYQPGIGFGLLFSTLSVGEEFTLRRLLTHLITGSLVAESPLHREPILRA